MRLLLHHSITDVNLLKMSAWESVYEYIKHHNLNKSSRQKTCSRIIEFSERGPGENLCNTYGVQKGPLLEKGREEEDQAC